MKIFTSHIRRNVSKNWIISTPKLNMSTTNEIKFASTEKPYFYPIKGAPKFESGKYTVFQYEKPQLESDADGSFIKLPQVPYEIKEHALKGFIYTFFLIWGGRLLSNFSNSFLNAWGSSAFPLIPLGVFSYHYLRPVYYMANAVTNIKLNEDGKTVIFEFKNLRSPIEVEIWRISKGREETFLNECYSEPFLFPVNIDYTDIYGEYSLRSKRRFYIYGDSNKCIKDGEIFRAIINSQSIKLH